MPSKRSAKQEAGLLAEHAALEFLQTHGLQLLQRNALYSVGELDLVMLDQSVVVFVEVRQRKNDLFGGAALSIDRRKQQKCARAAQCWLKQHARFAGNPCRFDAILFTGQPSQWNLDWIKDAFVFQDMF